MTDTTPPRDYPAEQWSETGTDYYVPPELREDYAAYNPSERDLLGYRHYGATVTEPVTLDLPHAVGGGRGEHDPLVHHDQLDTRQPRTLDGAKDYRTWLHLQRLDHAQVARRRAELHRHLDVVHGTCMVCGVRNPAVITGGVWLPSVAGNSYSERYRVSVCSDCAPVLTEAVRSAHADTAASRELPDGQTVGQVCADLAARIVADANQPAEASR